MTARGNLHITTDGRPGGYIINIYSVLRLSLKPRIPPYAHCDATVNMAAGTRIVRILALVAHSVLLPGRPTPGEGHAFAQRLAPRAMCIVYRSHAVRRVLTERLRNDNFTATHWRTDPHSRQIPCLRHSLRLSPAPCCSSIRQTPRLLKPWAA